MKNCVNETKNILYKPYGYVDCIVLIQAVTPIFELTVSEVVQNKLC